METRAGLKILVNLGGGLFENRSGVQYIGTAIRGMDCEAADFDGDGDLDLFVCHNFADDEHDRLLVNDGFGVFVDEGYARLPELYEVSGSCSTGDVNGDGAIDIVTGVLSTYPRIRYLENDGEGFFVDATSQTLPEINQDLRDIVLIDIDSDGDLEIMGATWPHEDPELDLVMINKGVPDTIPPQILYVVPHPETSVDYQGYPITVAVSDNITPIREGTLHYAIKQAQGTAELLYVGGHLLRAMIPAAENRSKIRYQVEVNDGSGNHTFWPSITEFETFRITSSPELGISVTADTLRVTSGDNAAVLMTIENRGETDRIYDIWAELFIVSGEAKRRPGILDQQIDAGGSESMDITFKIYSQIQPGFYLVRFMTGQYPLLIEDSADVILEIQAD